MGHTLNEDKCIQQFFICISLFSCRYMNSLASQLNLTVHKLSATGLYPKQGRYEQCNNNHPQSDHETLWSLAHCICLPTVNALAEQNLALLARNTFPFSSYSIWIQIEYNQRQTGMVQIKVHFTAGGVVVRDQSREVQLVVVQCLETKMELSEEMRLMCLIRFVALKWLSCSDRLLSWRWTWTFRNYTLRWIVASYASSDHVNIY